MPFLYTVLIRSENGIITDWYNKPTYSGRVLNFNSQHPFSQKLNLIDNLKLRALRLSNECFHSSNLDKVKSILLQNNYPPKLLRKILNDKRVLHTPNISKSDENVTYIKLTYVKDLTERISNILKKENLGIAQKPENTIKRFHSKLKCKIPTELMSNIVYQIPCKECDKVYVGQTGRYLKTRVTEHKRDMTNILNPIKRKENNTALAEHTLETLHPFDFNNVKILSKQNNLKKRLMDEMICIQMKSNCVNKRADIENLNTSYYNIISRFKDIT